MNSQTHTHLRNLPLLGLTLSVCLIGSPAFAQPPTAEPLSDDALEALVSMYAFHSDTVIENILDAAQQPELIRMVANGQSIPTHSDSLAYLSQYPDLIHQMNEKLSLTARLGVAARMQIEDVWAAIDRVRQDFANAQATGRIVPVTTTETTGTTVVPMTGYAYAPPAYAGYAAAFWTGVVLNELHDEYYHDVVTHTNSSTGTQTATTDNGGSVTTTSATAQVSNGNTAISGGVLAGSATGPNGNTVYGVGAGATGVTATETGTQFQSAGGAAIGNPDTGNYAAGYHVGGGSTQQNTDGSTSFDRSGTTHVTSSYGTTTIDRDSSGTAAGVGNSTYEGSTYVSSSHGDVSVETQAGEGQISSTVTTDNGSQTFTGGDGSVGYDASKSQTTSSPSESRSVTSAFSRDSGAASRFSRENTTQRAQEPGSRFSRPGNGTATTRSSFGRESISRPTSGNAANLRSNSRHSVGGYAPQRSSGLNAGGRNTTSRGFSGGGGRGGRRGR